MEKDFTVETIKQARMGDTFYARFKEAQNFFIELHDYLFQAYRNDDEFVDLNIICHGIVEDIETLMTAFDNGICTMKKTE